MEFDWDYYKEMVDKVIKEIDDIPSEMSNRIEKEIIINLDKRLQDLFDQAKDCYEKIKDIRVEKITMLSFFNVKIDTSPIYNLRRSLNNKSKVVNNASLKSYLGLLADDIKDLSKQFK